MEKASVPFLSSVRLLVQSLEAGEGGSSRPLTRAEIVGLEAGGNRCGDKSWRGVRVTVSEPVDLSRIAGSTFAGRVYLGTGGVCARRVARACV